MGKKAPKAPNFMELAELTSQAAREANTRQTWDNRINQYGPDGSSLTFTNEQVIDPATGLPVTQWSQHVEWSPEQKAAHEAQARLSAARSETAEGMYGRVQDSFGEAWDTDQYGDPIQMGDTERLSGAGEGIQRQFDAGSIGQFNPGQFAKPGQIDPNVRDDMNFQDPGLQRQQYQTDLDFSGAPQIDDPQIAVQRAEDSVYQRGASRLDPQFEQESQALDVRLRSQGLNPGDEAYDAQMRNFQDRKTDAYQALSNEAQAEGFRQGQGMFGMQSSHRGQMTGETAQQGQFRNQGLGQQFGQDLAGRGQDFDITSAIAQFGQDADLGKLEALITQRAQDAGMRGQDINAMVANIGQQVQQNALNLQAQGMGNAAQQQGWDQMRQQAGFNNDDAYRGNALANQLRTQNIGEDLMFRNQPLNELNSLLTGQQIGNPVFNDYNQAGRAQHTDYLGAGDMQHQANIAGFNASQAGMNSFLGGMGGMAGAAGSFYTPGQGWSDRRLKSNIRKIGEHNGVNWYSYEIFGRPEVGVMADEVPWAAIDTPSGYQMVDYRRV